MPVLSITVEKRVIARIQREARRAFPLECYVALLGRQRGSDVEILDSWIPKDLSRFSTEAGFDIFPDHWHIQANERAHEEGLQVLGHLHSHPYKHGECLFDKKEALAPSYGDLQTPRDCLMGIMSVIQGESGRLRTQYRIYGPTVSVKPKVA